MECGSNYARSMASYALLLTYSGFEFDMRIHRMGMKPIRAGSYFWSLEGCWGIGEWQDGMVKMGVRYGELALRQWVVPEAEQAAELTMDGETLSFTVVNGALDLGRKIILKENTVIAAKYR